MPEWLIERGIGETRAALIESGEIVEARVLLDGTTRVGEVLQAVLKQVRVPTIAMVSGEEYLLPKGAPGATEGAAITIEVTRERIPGAEPWKRPLARYIPDGSPRSAPALEGQVVPLPAGTDRLGQLGWDDVIEEARSGVVRFSGGELRIAATPAMTLVDVDGTLPPDELASAGAAQAARAIRRLDIGGSIGIDLPTASGKAARRSAAEALDAVLPKPFERTAVNGFGFVQIIRPRKRASLIELAQERAPFEARALLRRAAFAGTGPAQLTAHPAVIAVLEAAPDWLPQLAEQRGGSVSLRPDPKLPMSGGYASRP